MALGCDDNSVNVREKDLFIWHMSHMLPGLCHDCYRRISHDSPLRHCF